jgi:hypothetical protein
MVPHTEITLKVWGQVRDRLGKAGNGAERIGEERCGRVPHMEITFKVWAQVRDRKGLEMRG